MARDRGALDQKASRTLLAALRPHVEALQKRRRQPDQLAEGDALDAIAKGASAIAADHVARAQRATDPDTVKKHLECAAAALKLATREKAGEAGGGVVIEVHEADVGDDAQVRAEQASDTSAQGVH